jgi:uncharacterized repeat protein (TIGR01451 family)
MRPRRLIAFLLVPVALAAGLSFSPLSPVPSAQAAATTLVSETFGGTTVTDPGWRPTGSTCLTRATAASSLGVCATRTWAPQQTFTPGYAQLTDSVNPRSGGLLYNRPIPSGGGLEITFDQYQYSELLPLAVTGDGISFFLSDGSKDLATTGGPGSALGYAQNTTTGSPGVNGGYLGLGLDAIGNYGNNTNGKGAGCANQGAVGTHSNSVVLRGPGQGDQGYCYLTGVAANLLGIPLGGSVRSSLGLSPNPSNSTGRAVRITVSADTFPVVTVYGASSAGAPATTQMLQYTMTTPAPPTYKLGFAAVNSAGRDVHLVSNVVVSSLNPLSRLTLTTQVDNTVAQPATYKEGDVVPYQFVATNTSGTTALTSLAVTSSKSTAITCPATTIPARASVVCTGSHTVTAAEAAASPSTLINTATATANEAATVFTSNASGATVALAAPSPAMTLVKSASLADTNANAKADAGERINYSFLVRNTGNVTVSGITIADPKVTGLTPSPVTIAPGGQATVTAAPYVVTTANIASGVPITNSATAGGATASGTPVITTASTTSTPINYAPALSLSSTAALAPGSPASIGGTINYTFTATNTGTVPLTGVAITSPLVGLSARTYVWPGAAGTLAPGQTVTATATYVLQRAEVDAGVLSTTATVNGSPPTGAAVSATASPSVTIAAAPAITLTKTATPAIAQTAGQVVTFNFVATNTGNVTLSAVAITDALPGTSAITYGTWPPTANTLLNGQTVTATATYTVTAGDVAAGTISNTASVLGTPPVGSPVQGTAAVSVGVYPDPVADTVTVTQGDSITFNVLANDGGAATGALFTRASVGSAPRLVGAASAVPASPVQGSVTCVAVGVDRGQCTYQSVEFFSGTDGFEYGLSQPAQSQAWSVHVSITVLPRNHAPVATDDRAVATAGGSPVTISPLANDLDLDSSDSLRISDTTVPGGTHGTVSCGETSCTYTPVADGWTGTIAVNYTVSDRAAGVGGALTSSAVMRIYVDPARQATRGFHDAALLVSSATLGSWNGTTSAMSPAGVCVAGRATTTVSWLAVALASQWVVQRRLAGATPGDWTTVALLPGATTSYQDTRLGEGRSYEWRVRPDLHRWSGSYSPASATSAQPGAANAAGC